MNPAISRRDLLKKASALAAPMIIPASALGKDGTTAPSNRINMGLIGHGLIMGGHRGYHLQRKDVQVMAVCDVHEGHRQRGLNDVEKAYGDLKVSGNYKGCDAYNEFERIMDRDDIDAVVVGTPDHWHAPISVAAMRSGKDVYATDASFRWVRNSALTTLSARPVRLSAMDGLERCTRFTPNSAVSPSHTTRPRNPSQPDSIMTVG